MIVYMISFFKEKYPFLMSNEFWWATHFFFWFVIATLFVVTGNQLTWPWVFVFLGMMVLWELYEYCVGKWFDYHYFQETPVKKTGDFLFNLLGFAAGFGVSKGFIVCVQEEEPTPKEEEESPVLPPIRGSVLYSS